MPTTTAPALPAPYVPPPMKTFAPTESWMGPSYGWDFPSVSATGGTGVAAGSGTGTGGGHGNNNQGGGNNFNGGGGGGGGGGTGLGSGSGSPPLVGIPGAGGGVGGTQLSYGPGGNTGTSGTPSAVTYGPGGQIGTQPGYPTGLTETPNIARGAPANTGWTPGVPVQLPATSQGSPKNTGWTPASADTGLSPQAYAQAKGIAGTLPGTASAAPRDFGAHPTMNKELAAAFPGFTGDFGGGQGLFQKWIAQQPPAAQAKAQQIQAAHYANVAALGYDPGSGAAPPTNQFQVAAQQKLSGQPVTPTNGPLATAAKAQAAAANMAALEKPTNNPFAAFLHPATAAAPTFHPSLPTVAAATPSRATTLASALSHPGLMGRPLTSNAARGGRMAFADGGMTPGAPPQPQPPQPHPQPQAPQGLGAGQPQADPWKAASFAAPASPWAWNSSVTNAQQQQTADQSPENQAALAAAAAQWQAGGGARGNWQGQQMSATGYQGDPSQFNSWLPQQDAATQAAAAATTMPGGPQTAAGQAAYDAREVQRAQAKQEENAFHGPDKMAQQAALAQRMGYAGPPKGFQRWYTGQQRAAQQQARAAQPARGPSAYDEYMAWAGPQAQAQPAARGGAIEDGEDDGQPETYHGSGLIHSSVAGRTDRIPMSVAAGAYVIPADVVSGLGEGNTLSGAKVLDMMMHTGPFGMKLPEGKGGGRGIPAPPPLAKFARGGRPKSADDLVKVIVAGGEYVVHPMDVAKWAKNGDLTKGHDNLDKFVKNVRSDTATKLKKLPGPKT